MRRLGMLMVGLLAAGAFAPSAADAQFNLDPRALIGRMTAPLRHMLPHPRARQRVVHRSSPSYSAPAREADLRRLSEPQRQPEHVNDVQRGTPTSKISKIGIVGPQAWPSAYQDVIGYTFWPNDYEGAYRQHGFNDIITAIVTPTEVAPPPAAEARRRQPETTGSASSDTPSAPPCNTQAADSDWPKAQIEQTVQLDDTQRQALDRLQTTINGAIKSIRAGACRDTATLDPMSRLDATVQRLWAVQNASVVIRGALKNFYDTLSDDQKVKFRVAAKDDQANEPRSAPMGRQGACAQAAGDDRLMKQIQQTVRPTPQQKQSVEMLGKTSAGMAQYLMASCVQPTPDNPMARLDAANDRLTVINYAATSMEVALSQFSSALSDEQRKKFDALGR